MNYALLLDPIGEVAANMVFLTRSVFISHVV